MKSEGINELVYKKSNYISHSNQTGMSWRHSLVLLYLRRQLPISWPSAPGSELGGLLEVVQLEVRSDGLHDAAEDCLVVFVWGSFGNNLLLLGHEIDQLVQVRARLFDEFVPELEQVDQIQTARLHGLGRLVCVAVAHQPVEEGRRVVAEEGC